MQPHQTITSKPWGQEILLTTPDAPYVGKLIQINAGARLSLQYHDQKSETQCLVSGQAILWLEDETGELARIEMEPNQGYTIPTNRRHRLEAIEQAVVFEVSTPEVGTTVRVEDDYDRPDETEELRNSANRGWEAN